MFLEGFLTVIVCKDRHQQGNRNNPRGALGVR